MKITIELPDELLRKAETIAALRGQTLEQLILQLIRREIEIENPHAGAYWRKLKQRLGTEVSEVVTFCHGLKLEVC